MAANRPVWWEQRVLLQNVAGKVGGGGLTVSEQGVWLLSISGEGKLEGFQVKMSRGVFQEG